MSVSSNPENYKMLRYIQLILPITCVFVSVVIVMVFIIFYGFKRNRATPNVINLSKFRDNKAEIRLTFFSTDDHYSTKGDSISMSSTKVVYDSAHREECNSNYCQSPYATTRVSLYFQDNPSLQHANSAINQSENSYDMPLIKVSFP